MLTNKYFRMFNLCRLGAKPRTWNLEPGNLEPDPKKKRTTKTPIPLASSLSEAPYQRLQGAMATRPGVMATGVMAMGATAITGAAQLLETTQPPFSSFYRLVTMILLDSCCFFSFSDLQGTQSTP